MRTGAEAIIDGLKKQGVSTVFGYPGVAICPFYDCLTASDIRHILVRQEQNAGHAASGYARVTGKPGVCIATSGPGATNLITALATAYMDSIPLVAITGQVSSELLGRDVFQEADITGAAEPFTKYSYLVKNAADIPRIIDEAFYIAGTGRPGPVLIDLPMDIQQAPVSTEAPSRVQIKGYNPTVKGHTGQIKRVAEAIAVAQRPLICVGGGVFPSGAQQAVCDLSQSTGIPVVATLMGIGVMPTAHPNYFGMLGMHGKPYANRAVRNADMLIIIGARVGDRAVLSPEQVELRTKVIHIDIDPAEIGKNVGTFIPVVGDAATVVGQLLTHSPHCDCAEWLAQLTQARASFTPDFDDREHTINPRAFIRRLSLAMDDDGIMVADVGQNQIWTANNLLIRQGRFFTSGGMGTMGYSIPAALGAKLADPTRQVVAVCGDGSFQMSLCELATAAQNHIAVGIVVMKNNTLGMVREYQTRNYDDRQIAVDIGALPDTCALASAYGIPSMRVDSADQIDAAIASLLEITDGPALVECVVDGREASL